MRIPLIVRLVRRLEDGAEHRAERRRLRWLLLKIEARRLFRRLRGHDPDEIVIQW